MTLTGALLIELILVAMAGPLHHLRASLRPRGDH